jgi:hypothetical protein
MLVIAGQFVCIVCAANERIVINSYEVDIGSIVNVSIVIINAENIAGGSIKMKFNKSTVIVEDVIEGDFGTPITNINNTEGFIHIATAVPTAAGKANATFAIIKCKGVNEGYTELYVETADTYLNDEAGNIIVPITENGSIHVIPEFPSAIILLPAIIFITFAVIIARKKLSNNI